MIGKESNRLFWILFLLLIAATSALLARGSQEAVAATETLEWDVSAYCAPEVDIKSSANLMITVLPKTSVSGTEISAFMNLPDVPTQNAISHVWGYPSQGWHALLFQGPPVKATFYCQDQISASKSLHISYLPDQNTKIFLSSTETMGQVEIDTIGSDAKKSYHKVQANSEQMEMFSAGLDSLSPFWLTFAFPVHSPHTIKTTLQFQFD